MRKEQTDPKIDTFKTWLDQARLQVSTKSPTGEALKYIAKYWDGLMLFVTDGRIEMDTDVVEQPLFQVSLGFGGFSRQASTILA